MFLLEPNQTPYDLRWRMFGIPVRVHPMFWLMAGILGLSGLREHGFAVFFIWIACVFVSILIHELGHVWMGQIFGSHGHIVLYSFGGLAVGSQHLHQRGQRILVCLAGPLAGFLLLGILLLLLRLRHPDVFPAFLEMALSNLGLPDLELSDTVVRSFRQINPLEREAVRQMIFINLMWGLVNLLPVWPLDGGQISRDICTGLSPNYGESASLKISITVAALVAVYSLVTAKELTFVAVLFGLLALQSFQMLQHAHSQRRWLDDHWHGRDW